jgi:ubiquinone/menaquinone biosynthesis C-methylase UbiE
MKTDADSARAAGSTTDWDTSSHSDFFRYYEQQSLSPTTLERFRSTCLTLLRLSRQAPGRQQLDVLDIGCGAGAQCKFWLEGGHRYWGVDINQPLIELARERAKRLQLSAHFDVGTATALPFADQSMDVCLLPELLEHVVDWESCVEEAIRVLRPGGLIYITTTSKLCPIQEEFNLPIYSWYPARLKRYFERRAVTDWPAIANYAKYPAVNWFSYFGLRSHLSPKGLVCLDRFDLMDTAGKGSMVRAALKVMRALPAVRWLGHVCTPYTVLVARKQGAQARSSGA